MDLTAGTRDLAGAASTAARLFSPHYTDPVLAGILLHADGSGIGLSGNDRERSVSVPCPATVHTDGAVLVPAKALAETIRALDAPRLRLTVEGARLAIRVPGARFALPLLDIELHPGADARTPPVVAIVPGEALAVALRTVVGTTAKDDTLPMFTGVRLWSDGTETVRLLGSDRYRMAEVSVPAEIERPFDVLVPAALLGEIARRPARTAALRATENRFGVDLDGVRIGSGGTGRRLPHRRRHPDVHSRHDGGIGGGGIFRRGKENRRVRTTSRRTVTGCIGRRGTGVGVQ